jgi:hypothetical protein
MQELLSLKSSEKNIKLAGKLADRNPSEWGDHGRS